LVAHIDADTRMPEKWVRFALGEFEKYPKMVALTGPYIYYDLSPLKGLLIKIFYMFGFIAHYINQYLFSVGATLQGGNFIVRRKALDAITGLRHLD
jgi:cellulose synthase/poly-beta-1,6-N-acetylglucosamine synthase-like glycosyltransferase